MANPGKNMLMGLGVPEKHVYGTQEEKMEEIPGLGVSGRHLMQHMLTHLRENMGDIVPGIDLGSSGNIWIKALELHITNLNKKRRAAKVIISDVRFPDEALTVQNQNGFIIKVIRETDTDETTASHTSETSIDDIRPDYVIENNGTLEELYDKVNCVMEEIDAIYKKMQKAK
jgi:hypothetical protein